MFKLRFRNLFSLLLCGTLLLALAACDSDDGDDGVNARGDASVEISGNGVDKSFDWDAFFATGTDPETGNSGFVIYLLPDSDNPSQSSSFIYLTRQSTRPGTDTYTVADVEADDSQVFQSEFGLIGILSEGSQSFESVASTGGTVTISSSDDDRVEGSFNIDGTYVNVASGGQEVTVDITGDFEAPSGDFFVPGGF